MFIYFNLKMRFRFDNNFAFNSINIVKKQYKNIMCYILLKTMALILKKFVIINIEIYNKSHNLMIIKFL